MTHDVPAQTSIFATNVAASTWWVGDLLYRHGPGWQLVPPILIGAASLIGAVRGFVNDRQARRHKDELHQLELLRRRRSPPPFTTRPPLMEADDATAGPAFASEGSNGKPKP